jgi:hypothetical protein
MIIWKLIPRSDGDMRFSVLYLGGLGGGGGAGNCICTDGGFWGVGTRITTVGGRGAVG